MNFSDYWQENKRFVTTVVGGVLVFFVAYSMLDGSYGSQARNARRSLSGIQVDLREPMFGGTDRDLAEQENEALRAALQELSVRTTFEPRAEFQWNPATGSASNLYFQRVDEVTDRLRRLASRSRARIPDGLDLDMKESMTNDSNTTERHLDALDLIERVVTEALNNGISSVDRISVDLDPGFTSKQGLGAVERTRVQFDMSGPAESVTATILATQGDRYGRPVVLDSLTCKTPRRSAGQVKLNLSCSALRLHETLQQDELE
ncbi:MAG: hypothetical protein GY930_05480 [bacterium]|nr:hypothetical protein [bacterium]